MVDKIKKYILWFTIFLSAFYALYFFNIFILGFRLTNNSLNNVIILGMFLVPLLPFVWFAYVKVLWLKLCLYIFYHLLLIVFYSFSFLGIYFITNDVFSNNANGYRNVYERQIPNDRWLVIYRTPDQGALGGDHICPAIEKKIIPGVVQTKLLNENMIYFNQESDSNFVIIDNVRYNIPKESILRQKGKL